MLIPSYAVLKREYQLLKEKLSKLKSPVIYAHNDLLLENVLYNEKQKSVIFIDYEYTAYNYQAFDIVNHFAEFAGNQIFFRDTFYLYIFKIYQKSKNIVNLFCV